MPTPAPVPGREPAAILPEVQDRQHVLTARLRDTSERYRCLVEANIIGVTVSTEAEVLEANDEMLRLLGITRREFEARGVDWKSITPPEHLVADLRGIHEIRMRGSCLPFEKEFVHPDGRRVPVLVGGALLEKEPLKWIAFAVDLSERRRAEEERDRLVQEANAAREVAEAALHARDALLARVSHELRTPLAANVGYASMMRDGIPEPLPESQLENVRRMLNNQHHLLALIDGLMDFARGGAGGRAYDIEPLDVAALAAGVEPNVAPQLRAAELAYECPALDARLAISADRVKVTQVLVNLVANAIKFTAPGGVVALHATSVGNQVHLSVADTGTGIPAARITSVFEPFVQVGPPASAIDPLHPHGFGLGLAISRELARGMGGDLTVRSIEGEGSTFTLMLPEAQPLQ